MKRFIMSEKGKAIFEKYRVFFIIIFVGLLLMILPKSCEPKEVQKNDYDSLEFSVDALQDEIETMLSKSEGVGRVDVMLTLKSSVESVYAEEARVTRSQQESGENSDYNADSDKRPSVISDGSGKEIPVIVKQMYPEFLGATVVCDGAENGKVRAFITDAICALTGITADRIAIIKMKQ